MDNNVIVALFSHFAELWLYHVEIQGNRQVWKKVSPSYTMLGKPQDLKSHGLYERA
jgi:hypothetical protein